MSVTDRSPANHPDYYAVSGEELSLPPLILTRDDPQAIHHIVPEWFASKIDLLPDDLLLLDPKELKRKCKPSYIIEALRGSFWAEYNRVAFQQYGTGLKRINLARVYGGICSEVFFETKVIGTPTILAWILSPPQNYARSLEMTLRLTAERLHEIASQPLVDKNTKKFDHKLALIVMKAHEMIENRLRGTPTQRVLTANFSVPSPMPSPGNLEDLERKITQKIKDARRGLNDRAIEVDSRGIPQEAGESAAEGEGASEFGEAPEGENGTPAPASNEALQVEQGVFREQEEENLSVLGQSSGEKFGTDQESD